MEPDVPQGGAGPEMEGERGEKRIRRAGLGVSGLHISQEV